MAEVESSVGPRFELVDATLGKATSDLFGMWNVVAPEVDEASFAASQGEAEPPGGQVWRVDLPDAAGAAGHLRRAEEQLRFVEQGLEEELPARLDEFVVAFEARRALGGEEAFDASGLPGRSPPADMPEAEQELWSSLLAIEARGGEKPDDGVSFGVSLPLDKWQAGAREFQVFLDDLRGMLSHFARVDTVLDGRTVGRTYVDWTGDFNTLWPTPLAAYEVGAHHDALALALSSRAKLLAIFALTVQTAVKLGMLAASGAGLLLALPVIWRYVNQVLSEYRSA
jgi:hypothetical protein